MKAFASRRRAGRPKSERAAADQGTPEIQARRLLLARGADPVFAEYPLGLMLVRNLVNADQHWAGCRYGMLYRLSVGRTQVTYNRLYEALAGGSGETRAFDADSLAEARERFLAAKRHLLAAGRGVARAVEDLVVFNAWPRFLNETRAANDNLKSEAEGDLKLVRQGLDVLLTGFRKSTQTDSSLKSPSAKNNP